MSMNSNQEEGMIQRSYIANQQEEAKERKLIKDNFYFFGGLSFLYAIFYTFCEYKNDAGITIFMLEIGTIYFYTLLVKRLNNKLKSGSLFYIISILLLGMSIPLTDNWLINAMSKMAIMALMLLFMIHQFYEDSKWNVTKYLEAFVILFVGMLEAIMVPFTDAANAMKERQKKTNDKIKYLMIGIITAIPLTIVILSLLVSADMIFANMIRNVLNKIFMLEDFFWILLSIILCYCIVYCFINVIVKNNIKEQVRDHRILEPMIANTFTSIISTIYIVFSMVQIIGLFGARLSLPQGYTYSRYAREGFFQLLFVCGLNLVIVLCCMALFRESKLLKVLLTIISICTYIMLASSAYRMILYIQVYQLTFLRIFVLWSLVVIGLLMLGILIHLYKKNFPFFQYCMMATTVCYILFSFSRPDYFIARYNMNALEQVTNQKDGINVYEQYGDLNYVVSLSADAAKALLDYNKEDYRVTYYFEDIKAKAQKDIRTFNVSRYIAQKAANQYLNQ